MMVVSRDRDFSHRHDIFFVSGENTRVLGDLRQKSRVDVSERWLSDPLAHRSIGSMKLLIENYLPHLADAATAS
jgi:hypothetical protein